MISLTQLSKDRYDVFYRDACIGDFSRKLDEPFYFFPIQFRYNTAWDSNLLQAVADGLNELNKKE